MSKRASPTAIGAFVTGAVILVVVGILVFGSGKFFRKAYPFVLFFDGNVNGLNVGAPVKFKGVQIGQVTAILIVLEEEDTNARIPVYIELDAEKLRAAGVNVRGDYDAVIQAIRRAIDNGLRGQLQSESLVTGVLFVQLNYHPNTAANFAGLDYGTQEIPTLPTQIEQAESAVKQIVAKIDEIDFKALIDQLTSTAKSINGLADSPQTTKAIESFDDALTSLRRLSDAVDKQLGPVTESFRTTTESAQETARKLDRVMENLQALASPDSPLIVRLEQTLIELRNAAQSVRTLADELDRDPKAILFGRSRDSSEGGDK